MKKISIEIDDRLYQVLFNSSVEYMRSFRKQIVFDLMETYKEELAKIPIQISVTKIEEKHRERAAVKPLQDMGTNCIACGENVVVSPVIHAANGKLCKKCKTKKFAND